MVFWVLKVVDEPIDTGSTPSMIIIFIIFFVFMTPDKKKLYWLTVEWGSPIGKNLPKVPKK